VSAFVDGRFKYYGSDATIKERVRALEEKREAEHAIKEEKHMKRKCSTPQTSKPNGPN